MFLYCRSYLKPGAALPPPEALPQIQVQGERQRKLGLPCWACGKRLRTHSSQLRILLRAQPGYASSR